MWASWTEKATKGFTETLEKAGEAITQAATQAQGKKSTTTTTRANTEDTSTKTTDNAGDSSSQSEQEQQPTTTSDDRPTLGLNFQKFSEAVVADKDKLLKNFQLGGQKLSEDKEKILKNLQMGGQKFTEAVDKEKILKNFQMGWSSVVETTKRSIEATVEAVEEGQSRLEQSFPFRTGSERSYRRDPKLPLDVEALRDAEVVYITDRIITLSHPAMPSKTTPVITGGRKLTAIGHLLNRRHDGRFLVWNLSEVEYDVSVLDHQVLTFSFPGSPSPPLGFLLKLLVSMENWMKADDRNVAVVHCLTGRGRTSTVLAAFLCWMGEAGFADVNDALAYIATCKKIKPEELTIPSQRRYASYFKNMLDGVRPSQPPLLLKRIIMSEAPKFAKGPARDTTSDSEQTGEITEEKLMGCAPYLQIFKGGDLVYTSAATLHFQQTEEELPFVQGVDGPVPFNIEQIVQGDILIRCRHLTFNKQRVSMFRSAFHTGYVPPNVMRLTKSQLDGACSDKRFPDDFFLDLIFEKVDAETATKHLEQEEKEENETLDHGDGKDKKTSKKRGAVVKASGYDSMLHGDSRFWDVIAARRQEHVQHKNDDPMYGPTVGRRRGISKRKKIQEGGKVDDVDDDTTSQKERAQFETFSIGNEFDFLPKEPERASAVPQQPVPERDSLMEALMALDEDDAALPDGSANYGTEEIVFDHMDQPSKQPSIAEMIDIDTKEPADSEAGGQVRGDVSAKKEPSSAPISEKSIGSFDASEDMDAMLATADDDIEGLNLDDFDDDDDNDLEDLENMLKV